MRADRLTCALAARLARLGLVPAVQRPQPLHWTRMLSAVSVASAVVLLVTGLLLMIWYTPSSDRVVYDGPYLPLVGSEVSAAYASTMHITFGVGGGLLLRQAHHWAALLLPAALILQLLATFFTGGFRRPRRASWVLLVLLFIVVLAGGWSGYALPDDGLSSTGLRIVQGIVLGIPVVGTWASTLLFGGQFPSIVLENLYLLHWLVIPLGTALLVALRMRSTSRTAPARLPSMRLVAPRVFVRRWLALGGVVTALLMLLGSAVTISPIWLHGSADTGSASAGSQPDWYTGFLDGALRLVPPGWEFELLGYTVTVAVLAPLAIVGLFFAALVAYPFLEEWVTRGATDPDLLDRPRHVPTRTAVGVAGVVFYGVLWAAGSADLLATHLRLGLEVVVTSLQVLLIAGPVIGFLITRRVCVELRQKDGELLAHGVETGRIVRLPHGEYVEVHRPLSTEERELVALPAAAVPIEARVDDRGRRPLALRTRAALSRWFLAPGLRHPSRRELSGS